MASPATALKSGGGSAETLLLLQPPRTAAMARVATRRTNRFTKFPSIFLTVIIPHSPSASLRSNAGRTAASRPAYERRHHEMFLSQPDNEKAELAVRAARCIGQPSSGPSARGWKPPLNLQHWRGFRGIFALKAAPMLEFACFCLFLPVEPCGRNARTKRAPSSLQLHRALQHHRFNQHGLRAVAHPDVSILQRRVDLHIAIGQIS